MGVSSLGVRTTGVTSGQPAWELRAPAGSRARLLEISVFASTAAQQSVGFGRPTVTGVGPITPASPLAPEDPSEGAASTFTVAVDWATPPTLPNTFMRRVNWTNLISLGVIWSFPFGLTIPGPGSLVLWNITTTSANDVTVVIDE